MLDPCGSTEPLSVAEKLAINVAGLVMTTAGPVALKVTAFTILELPLVPPILLCAYAIIIPGAGV